MAKKTKKKAAVSKKAIKKVVKKPVKKMVKKIKKVSKLAKKPAKKTPAKKSVKKVVSKKAIKKVTKKAKKTKKSKQPMTPPTGYTSVTPYLIVDNAAAAIQFYKDAFGAIEIMRIQKEGEKVGHAELEIGGSKIMLADEYPELNARSAKDIGATPVSLHLYIDNVDAVVQKAVDLGAQLLRDVETMYYGDRSGGIQDPFGHQWYISTHVEDVSEAEIKKRLELLQK